MENLMRLSEVMTPEVAVLLRAALIAVLILGLEALSSAKRKAERKEVAQPKEVQREKLSKERALRT